jgi:hypothetical protein
LASNQNKKTVNYAKNLYWILNASINGYRMLSLGIVKKGDQTAKGRVGGIISKISTALGLT